MLASDVSPGAIKVCQARGVRQTAVLPVTSITRRLGQFDTILMLGNNFGLVGTPERARWLLRRFHHATSANARILAQSVDPVCTTVEEHLAYQRQNINRGRPPGELRIRVRYRRYVTPWLAFLLVSQGEMAEILVGTGWHAVRFLADDGGPFVAVIEKLR